MSPLTKEIAKTENALGSLHKTWFTLLILQALLLMAGTLVLLTWWADNYALRWLGLATASSLVFLGVLWRSLSINSRPGEEYLLPEFGPVCG